MKKLTYEFVEEQFEKDGSQLLSKEYMNNYTPLDYVCPKGHKHSIRWDSWQRGQRCRYCYLENCSGENNPNWKDGISNDPEYQKQWYQNNKGYCDERTKQWQENNRERCNEYRKQYYQDNPEKCKEYRKQYYQDNKYRVKKRSRQYYQDNIEREKERCRQYAKNNPGKVNALEAKHRARKLNQTPIDANMFEINKIYSICSYMNSISINCKWHVDHIKPLSKGGLHHQDNLQILDAIVNIKKSNKYEIVGQEG